MQFFKPFEMPVAPVFPDRVFDIRNYGAVEGGEVRNTAAIERAITACNAAGGGRVRIPDGKWLTGPIHFQHNVEVHLDDHATVLMSPVFTEYLPVVLCVSSGRYFGISPMIYANGKKNIALTGNGTIDGQGNYWWKPKDSAKIQAQARILSKLPPKPWYSRISDSPKDSRPGLYHIVECENVLIDGIHFINSPAWTVHTAMCRNVIIRNVSVVNPWGTHNTDGINLNSCKRALIEHCFVDTSDDVICMKSGKGPDAVAYQKPCEDVVIRYCSAQRGHGGIVIGSETSAGIRNALVHDCHFHNTWSGVRIKTMQGRGNVIENLEFRNIKLDCAHEQAVYMTLRYTGEPTDDHTLPFDNMPKVRNILVKGMECGETPVGVQFDGVKGFNFENIYLEDLTFAAQKGIVAEYTSNLNMKNIQIV